MVILGGKDLYEVKLGSLIADYDRKTLTDLYMPIVGYTAICIYFVLWSHSDSNGLGLVSDHEHLLVSMQISTGKFIEERKKLEGIGLLRTHLKKEDGVKTYTYSLYAPKTPADFFSDTLLFGLLNKYLGEKAAARLKNIYLIGEKEETGEDISATFAEIFNPDFKDPSYSKALQIKKGEILNRIQSQVDSEFNYKTFKDLVNSHMQVNKNVFTKTFLKEVERLALLFGVDEEDAAVCFESCYDETRPTGKKVDMVELKKMFMEQENYAFLSRPNSKKKTNPISSDTVLAKKINWMEDASCKDFLQQLQGNRAPVLADLKLVDDLSTKLGLLPPVINAILDYCLQNDNNRLSRSYVEKIAGSVARERCETAYDTLVYLHRKTKNGSDNRDDEKPFVNKSAIKTAVDEKVEEIEKQESEFDQEAWEKMLEEIGG